ncbi:MAG: hypothetical protein K0R10_41 [Alphaproteobacteria bacterium]|jgi:hypothetical protein|nr:hypothetical protein [Alphaproteobacteria bacterium]
MSFLPQLDKLKPALDAAFERISKEFNDGGVTVLMPTYSPSQGRLLSEFNRVGGKAVIVGGMKDKPSYKNVPQFGLDFDTTAYINMFPQGMSEQITGTIPEALLKDKKVAIFAFITPPASWAKHIADRKLNTDIVATNEQNTRLFFENKGNLMHILKEAGLEAYVIPTEVVSSKLPEKELRAIYHRMKNDAGKVVVQPTVENYEPTRFIGTADEFVRHISKSKIPFKVVRFVEGNEANLSFFAGNTLPAENGRGVVKTNLPDGIDRGDANSLALIEAHAAEAGINESNVFSVTGRATLKVVGDRLLANEPGDSVGNNIGHVYEEHIARQITEIGEKLGKKMALSGKVGHAGADLIIDRSGKIWINEINDRQQGPTDQMSADAESNNLPGLSRLAWFAHYADFSKPENLNLLSAIRDNADAIHAKYMNGPGSFYIKAFATHDASYDGKTPVKIDLPAGVYTVTRKVGGAFEWKYAGEDAKVSPVDLTADSITVQISSGSLKKGDTPPSGAELFRVTGIASGANSPFIIENGVSTLNPVYRTMLEQLYKDAFGEGYIEKNPQYRARAVKPGTGNDNLAKKSPAVKR